MDEQPADEIVPASETVPLTGDPATDEALAAVAGLDDDLTDHVAVLRQAHLALQDWLRRD